MSFDADNTKAVSNNLSMFSSVVTVSCTRTCLKYFCCTFVMLAEQCTEFSLPSYNTAALPTVHRQFIDFSMPLSGAMEVGSFPTCAVVLPGTPGQTAVCESWKHGYKPSSSSGQQKQQLAFWNS